MRELSRQLGAICQGVASRRVETGDTAPVTVVAVAGEAGGLAPARRRLTVAELLGPPRYDSLPDRVRDALSRERDRVPGLHPADPEAVAAQAWLEVAAGLPWRREVEERLDAVLFRQALDREHVGRGCEKDQALDYLVARQDRGGDTRGGRRRRRRPRSSALPGRPASAGPRSRGRWPRPSPAGSSASRWPAPRTPRRGAATLRAGSRHLWPTAPLRAHVFRARYAAASWTHPHQGATGVASGPKWAYSSRRLACT